MSDDVKELLDRYVQDEEGKKALNDLYSKWTGSALRSERDEAHERAENAEKKVREYAFKEAGFDPTTGPGKALAKLYDGEADPEAIQSFARDEFGFEPTSAQGGNGENPENADNTPDPSAGEDRLAQLNSGAIPARTPTTDDQIKQAEASGDWDTFNRLNAQKLEAVRNS